MQNDIFGRIIDIVFETLPRDNLLNSACLELFEFVKRENIKPIVNHVVETYRERLQDITYVDLFEQFVLRYDQMQGGYGPEMEGTLFSQEEEATPMRAKVNGTGQRWQGVQEMDADEEQYFNTSDDEEESPKKSRVLSSMANGTSPPTKPLVDYPDDDDENFDAKAQSVHEKSPGKAQDGAKAADTTQSAPGVDPALPNLTQSPFERLAEKRRREEDDEDELGKLSTAKRRSSSGSGVGSNTSGNMLRRKKSFSNAKETAATGKKIAISLSVKSPIETEQGGGDGA